ncbi:MAG: DUF58 domain-containing protein [Lachnospiraceae bacterium]|nr:DUF58 domain-containing protein [Lachnospiraceae bacterium]
MIKTFCKMQKQNLSYALSYFCFLVLFCIGALFYRQPFTAILLLLLIILPFLSVFFTSRTAKKIRLQFHTATNSVEQGYPILFTIAINNPSFFPLLNCNLSFSYENLFYPKNTAEILSIPANSRKETKFTLSFDTAYAGMVQIEFDTLFVTDYLHLYTFRIPLKKSFRIPVLVPSVPYTAPILFSKVENEGEEDSVTSHLGLPSGEIKEIREYHPGDKLQNIHWKMSAKTDDLLVKEFDRQAEHFPVIIPELYKNKIQDTLLTLNSLCEALLAKQEIFRILLFHPGDKSFSTHTITDRESLHQTLLTIYFQPLYPIPHYARDTFLEETDGSKSFICIDGKEVTEEKYS